MGFSKSLAFRPGPVTYLDGLAVTERQSVRANSDDRMLLMEFR